MMSNARKQIIGENLPLKDIETALQSHWRNSVEKESEQAVMKASTLNLLVLVKDDTSFRHTLERVEDVISHHPGRMIIAQVKADGDDEKIQAHLSAYSQKTKGGQTQIAAEFIVLSTGKGGARHLAGAILPLLLPDVPVFFWQPEIDDLLNPNFRTLLKYTDRLIINSPAEYDTMARIGEMTKSILSLQQECNISDLRWAELTEWREAIARIFDSENHLKLLEKIDSVEITYSGAQISGHAILLAGWLAQALNKIPRSAADQDGSILFQKRRGESVAVKITKKPPNGFVGLNSVKLIGKSDARATIFTAKAIKGGGIKITTQEGGSVYPESIFRSMHADDSQLLCDELDFVQQDRIYLDTLQTISEFLNEK